MKRDQEALKAEQQDEREAKKKAIIKIDDQSKDVRKNIAEMSEGEWQNYLKQMDGSDE